VLIPVQSGTAYARYFAMSLTTRMRISRNTLRRGVESRLVPVFLATVIEGDVDALESFSALSFGLPGIGLAVSAGQFDIVGEGSQQGTRVEAIGGHHVGLGAQQQCRGDQIQEGQQTEHQSKHTIGRTRRLDHLRYVDCAEPLQQLPDDRCRQCTGSHLTVSEVPGRSDPECDQTYAR